MSRSKKRHVYRRSRVFDRTCRCHGSCPFCRSNRLHQQRKELDRTSPRAETDPQRQD